MQNLSKEDIKKSINALRENFENQLTINNYQLNDFPSPSLQSLIEQTSAKRALRNSLSPEMISSIYRASNLSCSRSNYDTRAKRGERTNERDETSKDNLSLKSSASLSEIFRKQSSGFFSSEKRNSRGILVT